MSTETAQDKGLQPKPNLAKTLKVSEAALVLGVSASTLRNLEKQGRISSQREENKYRTFREEDVLKLSDILKKEKAEKKKQQKLTRKKRLEKYAQADTSTPTITPKEEEIITPTPVKEIKKEYENRTKNIEEKLEEKKVKKVEVQKPQTESKVESPIDIAKQANQIGKFTQENQYANVKVQDKTPTVYKSNVNNQKTYNEYAHSRIKRVSAAPIYLMMALFILGTASMGYALFASSKVDQQTRNLELAKKIKEEQQEAVNENENNDSGFLAFTGPVTGDDNPSALPSVLAYNVKRGNYDIFFHLVTDFLEDATFRQNINVDQDAQITGDLAVTGQSNLNGGTTTPTLTFNGVATMNNLLAIDDTTETTLEQALDIDGDVVSVDNLGLTQVRLADEIDYAGTFNADGTINVTGTIDLDGNWQIAGTDVEATADEINTLVDITTTAGGIYFSDGDALAQDASNLFYNNSSDRLGVGTNSPSTTLEVEGTITTDSIIITTGATNNYILTSDANGNATWQAPSSSSQWTLSGSNLYPNTLSYNVGIGTSSPSEKLEVNGNILITSGTLTVGSIGIGDTGVSNVTSGASLIGVFDEFANSSATNLQDVLDDLDAAIGGGGSKWTDPGTVTYLTDTADDLAIGGSEIDNSAFYFDISTSSIVVEGTSADAFETTLTFANPGADATVTVPATTGTLALGTGTANQVAYWSGTNTLTSEAQLSASRGGTGIDTSGATGIASINAGTWSVNATLSTALGGTGVDGSSASNGQLLIGNGTGYTLANLTGGVGIGITNAAGSITITNSFGTSIETGEITDGTILEADLDVSNSAVDNYVLTYNSGGTNFTWVNPSALGTNYWQQVSGVLAPATISDDLAIGGTAASDAEFFFDVGNELLTLRNTTAGNSFVVYDQAGNDTTPFVIDEAGNVGIGTSNPGYALDVNGTARIASTLQLDSVVGGTDNTVLILNGSNQIVSDEIDARVWGTSLIDGSGSGNGVAYFTDGDTIASEAQLATSRGGTGIDGSSASNGQILIGNGTGYSLANLTGGVGIGITNAAGSITITNSFGTSIETGEITDGTILEADLDISNTAVDNYVLTYNAGGTNFTWVDPSTLGAAAYWQQISGALSPSTITDDLAVGGTAASDAEFFFDVGNELLTLRNTTAGNSFVVYDQAGNDTTPFVIDEAGNVGIGTSNPGFALDVNGTVRIESTVQLDSVAGGTDDTVLILNGSGQLVSDEIDTRVWGTSLIDGTGSANGVAYFTDSDTIASEAQLAASRGGTGIDTSGSTGVASINSGTWSVAATLSTALGGTGVDGSSAANGQLLIGNGTGYSLANLTAGVGIGITNAAGSITINNSLGTSIENTEITDGTILEADLDVSNTAVDNYVLTYNAGGTNFTWVAPSSLGTNYWQQVSGVLAPATIADDLAVGGTGISDAEFYFDVGNELLTLRNTTGGNSFVVYDQAGNDTTPFIIDEAGSVGIGTSNPGFTLDVNGTVRIASTVQLDSVAGGTDNTVLILNGSNQLVSDEIDARVWGSTLIDGSGSGNGVAYFTDGDTIASEAQLSTSRGGTGLDGSSAANGQLLIGNGTGYSLANLTAGVGIGITNAAGSITINNSLGTSIETGEITDGTVLEADLDVSNTAVDNYVLTYNSGGLNFTWVDPSGLGTNYWNQISGVLSPATISDDLAIGGTAIGDAEFFFDVGNELLTLRNTTGGNSFVVYDQAGNDTTPFVIDEAGSVGIGTTNPGFALDVNGTLRVASTVQFDSVAGGTDDTVLILNGSGQIVSDEIDTRVWGTSLIDGSGSGNGVAYFTDGDTIASEAQLATSRGGTGLDGSSAANGQLLIGNGTGYSLANLTAGVGIGITNAAGSITINNSLGTSIETGEITDGEILEADLDISNTAVDNYVLTYNAGGTNFTWVDPATLGTNYWQQVSGVLAPATISDDLAIGGTAVGDAEFYFDVGNELLTLRNTTGGNSFVVYDQAGNDTTPFVIDEAGNVGIGTSNPGFALDVNGTVRLASTVQLDSVAGGTDDTVLILNGSGQIVSDEIDTRVWGTSLIDGSGSGNGVAYFTDGDTIASEAQLSTSRGGTGLDGSSAANGQLLIGNGTGYSLANLTAGVGIGITNAAGSITINNSLGTSIETGEITDGTILEADLDISNTAIDNYVLTYNAGGSNFTWVDPSSLGGAGYWQQNSGVLAPLTISDDLAVGGTAAADAEFYFDVGNELLTLRNTTGGNSFVVYDQAGNDTTPFVIDEAGSVGIGTSNPGFTLDVNGTVRIASTVQLDSVAGGTDDTVLILNGSGQIVSDEIDTRVWGTSLIDGSGSGNGVAYFTDGDTIASEAQLSTSRGGTGVDGSSAANGQLLIGNGTGYSLANLTAGIGIGITNAAGSITINNSLGTSIETGEITDGTILEADLDISNTAVDNYVLTYNSGGLNFTWVDPAALGTNYWQQVSGVLAPATIADDLAIGGTAVGDAEFFFDVGNELLTLRNTTGGNSFVVYDQAGTDATPFLIDEGGNVAIGGTNPAAALSVGPASEFRVSSSGNLTRVNNVAYSWPASQAAGAGYILSNDSSGNLSWVDSSGVGTNYWQQVSGALSPATISDDLAIGGTGVSDAEFYFDVGNELLTLRNTTGGNSFIVYDQSGTDATPFLIDEGGNVAIGGTNPAAALTVGAASEFRVNSSGNVTRINNVAYSWPASQAAGSGYVLSNDSSGNLSWVDSAGVGTNYWNQISGVLSPATIADDLAIGGTAIGDAEFFFDVGNELLTLRNTTGGNSFVVYDQAGNDTTPFVIDEAGSVGIGTTNPGFALDINGTLRVASTVQFDSVAGGTDNTVLILNGSNQLVSDEIDSRVWGTSLIDGSGSGNGVAYFTDGDTIASEAQLATSRGGTGLDGSSAANGQLLIGNGTGYSLANLTAGVGIGITNAAGSITINNSLGTSIETGEITDGTILEADLDVSNTAVDNYVLTYNSGGLNFTWVDPSTLGTNYWNQISGVLSPATIADDLAIGGTAAADAEFFFDVGNELLTLRNTTGGNSFVVYDQAGNDTTPFVIDEAGSVGIGTSNPGFALDVNGTVRLASTVQLDSVAGGTDDTVLILNGSGQIVSDEIDTRVWGTSLIDGSGSGNGVAYFTDGDTIASEAQLATSRGGTGLDGSSAANGQLLIGNGTGYSLANLTAGVGIGITNAAGSITINNSLGTSIETGEITDGEILEADLDVSNTAVDNYVLTYNAGGSNFTWVNPSSVGTNYWQQVSGVLAPATIADDLAVGGTGVSDAEFYFDVGNELLTLRNTTGGNSFVVYDQAGNDTTPFVIDEAGSVGIGTSNPGFALDVNGTVRIASTVQLDSVAGGTDNTVLILNGSNQLVSDEIDARVWGTSLIDGSGSGNGVAYFTDGDTIASEAQLSTSRGGTGLDGSSAANGQLLIGNSTGYSLANLTAGVGIGITNAAGSITINNSLGTSIETGEITDGEILEADLDVSNTAVDNYVLTYNAGGSNFTWVNPSSVGTNYWQQVSGVLSPATISDDLAIGGTGVSDAEFFFDVGNELLTLRNTTGGNSFVVYDQAGNDTTPFVIDEAGSVGIGTSNPGFTLDVNGTVRVAGTVQLDSVVGGTDNTVLILNGSNQIVSDEIDSRVWGTSLIDGSGSGNGVAYFTDGDTIASEAQLATSRGGTGLDGSSAANGQLLIGNGTGYSLANLTAGVGIGITNAAGSITINNSLGTSIETGEITDGTILEADLDVSNTAVDNYVLTYNSGGLNFTWVDPSGLGTNYWQQVSGVLSPATISDDLAVGGTGVSDAEFFFDGGNELLTLRNTTGGNSFVVYDQAGNDTTPFVIDEAGSVGIGTSNPGFALDVNGTVRLASTVQLDSVAGGTDNTVLILNGSNQIVSDEIDARVWGTSLIDGSGSGNGVAYFTDGDTITSEAQLATSRGGTGLDGSSAANGQLLIGNGTGYSLANLTAGVGIGITNATGSITINNSLGTSIETGEITDGTILEADLDISNTAVDNYVLTYNSGGLNFTWVDPSTLGATGYWQRNTGVLAPLTIADDLAIGGTTASDAEFFFDVGNELLTLRNTTGGNSFVVYDQAGNDTTPFVIDEAGSVGIGTSNPGFALDVNGTVRVASTVQLDSVAGGTDNTVLILNGSNQIVSDEIDSRVWGTSLIDGSGSGNGVAYFTDGDTIASEAQLATSRGGTGLDGSSAANGQLLIGNSTGYSLANLTAGVGIGITNAAGSITINNSLGTSIETGEITDGTILEADLDISNTAVDNYVLTYNSGGLNFTWVDPATLGTNYWTRNSSAGILYPATTSDDLAIGGTGPATGTFFVDAGTGNVTTDGDVAINGGDLTSTATTFNFDVGDTGDIFFRDGTNTLLQISDEGTTGNLYGSGVFSFGDTTPDGNAYNTIGTGDATATNVDASDDLFVDGTIETGELCLGTDCITNFNATGRWSLNTTPTPDVLHMDDTTWDLAIGGTTATDSPFFFDVSTGTLTFDAPGTGTLTDYELGTAWTGGSLITANFGTGTTQASDIIGFDLDFDTNFNGVADADFTGIRLQTPDLTSTGATTTNLYGLNLSAAGALDTSDVSATNINWYGLNVQMPNIDTGDVADTTNAYGIYLAGGTQTNGAGTENSYALVTEASAGNVGIGITAPANQLHAYINGTGDLTSANGAQVILEQDSTGDSGIQFELTGGQIWSLGIDNSSTNDDFVIFDGSESIFTLSGVGTSTIATLGSGAAEDTSLSFNGNAQDFYIALDDSLDDLIIGTGSTVGANDILTLENTGEVGIGITNPVVDLHVVGNRVSAAVGVERMFWLEDRDTATASGAQYLGLAQYEAAPSSSSSALYVPFIGFGLRTGSNAITGRMYGVAGSVEDISSNTTTAEARAIAGQVAITGSAANTTLTSAMAGHFQVNNQDANSTISNAFGVYVYGGTNSSTVTSRAGVAIGNSTSTNSTNYTNLLIDNVASPVIPSGVYSIFNESTRNNYFAGDLGIGISSPANELHVYSNDTGDIAVANGAQLILEQDSTGDAGIQFELTGGKIYSLGIDNSSSDNFVVLDGSTERLRLDSSSGEFRVANDAVIIDNTTLGDASGDTVTSNAGAWTFANATTIDLANTQTRALNIESGLLNLDTSNTRVGIGTTAPTATLDVVGSITASGDLTLDGGDITGANSAAIDIGEAGSGDIQFYADGDTSDYIYLDTTSNEAAVYFENAAQAFANDAGIRINGTTGELEYRDENEGTWTSFDSIGGASTTLDDAYNNDADGSDVTIGLTTADDSIIIQNPSSSGTDSAFLFQIDNQATTGTAFDVNVANTSGELINIDWNGAATQAGAITGIDLDFTNLTTDGTNTIYGIHINDQVGNTASTEYGIYQQGTNWDFGGFFEDDFYIGGDLGIGTTNPVAKLDVAGNINSTGDLTLDGGDITGANSAAIDIGEAGSGDIQFYADGDTDDYIYTDTTTNLPGIYWGTGMSTNDAGIRISATDDTGQLEYRDQNSGTWVAFDSIGGASTTLDDAYNNDADGSDATIGLTSTDGSIIVDNPSSSGTASGFLFRLNNQATSGTALDVNVANTSGELINVDWNASATQAGAITGLDLDFTNLTTDGTNSLYGLHINDQVGNTASTEYAIYQQGTNWDFGGFFEDDFYIGGNLGIGDSTPTARLDVASTSATAAGLNLTADSLTTGTGSTFSFDALTSGTGILVESDGSNTITGDLFRINIGSGTTVTGNLFTIEDNGTELFSVGQSQITSALPHQFTAAGDVSFANDIQFTSQTASYIKSNAPLYLEAGESFENNDLTLLTYGTGDVVLDLKQGNLLIGASNPAIVFDTNTATDTDFWFGVLSDQGGDNDDILVFGDGTAVGTNNFVALDTSGNFGIGTTAPSYVLNVEDNHNDFNNFVAYFHNLNTGNSASGVGIQLGPNSNPTADNNFIKFIDGDGTVVGAIEGNGTNAVLTSGAADFAELMIGDRDRVGIGDILCLDRTGEVVAATQGCTSLAAYSNRYIVLGNAPEGWEANDNLIPVGLLGQLEIKVKTSNGTILPGDPISVSNVAGVGEKAVSSGQVVGYAVEGYINNDPTKVGKIEVMIRPSWYDPTSVITASGNLAQNNQEILNYDDVLTKISTLDINEWTQGNSGVIRHLGPNANEFYEAFGLGQDGQVATTDVAGIALAGVKGLINRVNVLEQDQLDLESLEADILGLEEQLTTVEQDVASLQDEVALLSEIIANGGVLGESTQSTESTETTESTEALDPSGVLASIVEMFAQIQDFVATLGMHVTTDDEGNEVLAFTSDVNMTGDTTLYNATVTGTLDVGLLKIDSLDNSINVTGATCYNPLTNTIDETLCDAQKLSIQNNLAGNVEFFDGSIKLTPEGTLEATTIIADSVVAGAVSVREDGGTVGKSAVSYGTDKVTIYTTAITNDSKVFVTARSNTNGEVLRVDNVVEGISYDVILSGNAQNDIEFDWLIVN